MSNTLIKFSNGIKIKISGSVTDNRKKKQLSTLSTADLNNIVTKISILPRQNNCVVKIKKFEDLNTIVNSPKTEKKNASLD